MKHKLFLLLLPCLLFTGCYGPDRQLAGTMIGANLGGTVGGAIGARSGGFAGDVFGTIIGTVAGAAIGSAVTAPSPEEREYNRDEEYYDATREQRTPRYERREAGSLRESTRELAALKVRNLRFIDGNRNRIINANETCQLLFEVYNSGDDVLRDITPEVYELNRMKHIRISNPSVISRIGSKEAVRYTITIRTDKGLREGTATFCISLSNREGTSIPCREFDIQTSR